MRQVAVIGVGLTKVDLHFDKSIRELFREAVSKALDDALNPDIEAAYIGNMAADEFNHQKNLSSLLVDFAGFNNIPATRIETGESSGGSAIIAAFNDVASGSHDFVLVGGVEKMSEAISAEAESIISLGLFHEYETIQGLSPEGAAALVMRLYMHKYNVSVEDIALLAQQDHKNAVSNPYAQLRFEVTIDSIINARPIADPITLMNCAPLGDGAAALILCPLEKAKKITDTPIQISGIGQASDSLGLTQREDLLDFKSIRIAAEKAYQMAKIKPEDIQVAEIFDSYTIYGLMALEELGFARRGEAAKLLKEGYFSKNGGKPVNISGGLKARGHPVGATGVYQTAEIALTLRGDAQLKIDSNPVIGLSQTLSGAGSNSTIQILRRV
ncbi:MAG: thiolase domain-containing protein [Candidatus Odinarchaeota archaeon]